MASDCDLCAKLMKESEKIFCQGGCGRKFHMKCVGISAYDVNNFLQKDYLVMMCMACREKIRSIHKIEVLLNNLNEKLEKMEESVKLNNIKITDIEKKIAEGNDIQKNVIKVNKKVTEEVKKVVSGESNSLSYANVLKSAVLIKPKKSQKADETKNDLRAAVNPADIGIPISAVKKLNSGAVIVKCDNDENAIKLKENIENKLGSNYNINKCENKKPRIKILGVRENIGEERLILALKNQNEILKNAVMEVKAFWKSRGVDESYSAVVELDVKSYNSVLEKKRVNIEWDKCLVKDGINVQRCFKCLGFNHSSNKCKEAEKVCCRCAKVHLGIGIQCSENELNCINCVKVNKELNLNLDTKHSAFDLKCKVYERKLNSIRNRIWQ